MSRIAKRACRAGLSCLFAVAAPAAWAGVIWSENFDAATPGQVLDAPPLNWTADYGTIAVEATPHPGWVGNAIVGTSAIDTDHVGGAAARPTLPAIPTVGEVEFGFDAWAPSGTYGASINLELSNGDSFYIQAWTNNHFDNEWFLYKWSNAENRYTTEWSSGSNFMRDRSVHVALSIDYDLHTFDMSFDDGSAVVTTPTFAFAGEPALTRLSVYEDTRGGYGVDLDNLQITGVPEPGAWLLMSGGLVFLGWRARRGCQTTEFTQRQSVSPLR